MTTYEHAMLGLTLALAAGAHRRHGWSLPATAAVAAALPDWDAAAILFGADSYSKVHRVWGHNLLCAGLLGALTGGFGYWCYLSTSVRHRFAALFDPATTDPTEVPETPRRFRGTDLVIWVLVGLLAGLTHLLADVFYDWSLPLLWPFAERCWSLPILSWGDMPPIVLLLGEMFVLYYRPRFTQSVAWLTLVILVGYVWMRWLFRNGTPIL